MNRRNSTIVGAILGIVSALLLAGIAHAQPADEAREEFHQTYSLSANGRVELSNVNGDVNISAWDTNQVKVDAVKHARSADRLNECKIVVDAQPDSIRIETKYPESWFGSHDNSATVDYTIKVPRGARLDKVSAVNGNMVITEVAGGVHGSAVNGSVKATEIGGPIDLSSVNSTVQATVATAASKDIRLHSVNGRVSLTVPSDTQAEVNAKTVNGSIENDFGLGVDKGRYVGSTMKGQLGSGVTRIDLKTVNGPIELHHANDGKPVSKAKDLQEHSREPL
jgi:DUF4097 and DUF4098 domain-containing protein YvlB